ncbi:hypothetical protein EV175_005516 [Coemansia sp. RSA 1933]|nr:hypothetical protein EV175_005516 [Coemansia sp. RSA 1933]
MRRRATSTAAAQQPPPPDAVPVPLSASRASSVASAPGTIAESLRSFWEARRSTGVAPRRATGGPLFRNLYRSPTSQAAYRAAAKLNANRPLIVTSTQVNASVSRLVALILRDFVEEWYEKITDDKEFLGEVSAQVLQLTNELERRCRRVDWVRYILFELPEIIHLHVRDSQQCMARLGTVYAGNETSIEAVFQSMQPHVALARAANSELSYLRHLAKELLVVLLPPEAQTDEVVHHLLREIVACAVLRNVVDVVADPNTLNEAIIRSVGKYSKREYFSKADLSRYNTLPLGIDDSDNDNDEAKSMGWDSVQSPGNADDRAGAAKTVSVETMLRDAQTSRINASSNNRYRKDKTSETMATPDQTRTRRTAAMANKVSPAATNAEQMTKTGLAPNSPADIPSTKTSIIDNGVSNTNTSSSVWERLGSQLSFSSLWLIRDLFSQARWRGWKNNTIRGMVYLHLIIRQAFSRIFSMLSEYTFSLNQLWQADTPQASYRGAFDPLLALLNAALLLDRYNQWVWAQFLFYIYPLVNILAGAAIDRTLVNVVSFLMSEQQIASYVDMLVSELWRPEDGGRFKGKDKRKPYKTLEQQELLKKDTADLVAEMLPYVAVRFFYGLSDEERQIAAQRILEPFENRQLNKHLIYNVLDSIVGKIAPELKESN